MAVVMRKRKLSVIDLDRAQAARDAAAMSLPALLQATGELTGPYRRPNRVLMWLREQQRRLRWALLKLEARRLLRKASRIPKPTTIGRTAP